MARRHALTLWSWGEQLKHKIGMPVAGGTVGSPAKTIDKVGLSMILGEDSYDSDKESLSYAIVSAAMGDHANKNDIKDYWTKILKIEVTQAELDSMIARQVVRTMACCRSLIERKLPGERDKVAPVVHKVALTGGASRYPLIKTMLLDRLQVADLEPEHWFYFEEDDLKSVVAKGAVLALAAMSRGGDSRFHFDSRMAECLPFDVAYRSFQLNEFRPVYRLQQPYDSLQPTVVPIAEVSGDSTNDSLLRQLSLFRRFPGDGDQLEIADRELPAFDMAKEMQNLERQAGYEHYITWAFDEQIQGDVTVSYDRETHTFNVKDKNENEGRMLTDASEQARSRAPHERGTL